MDKFAKRYVNFIINNSTRVIILMMIISIVFGLYAIFGLKINADITGLAPKDDPEFQDLIKYTNEKVTSNTLIIAISQAKETNSDTLAQNLKELFEKTEYVHQAEAFDNPETLVKYGMLAMSEGSVSDTLNYYQSLFNVEPKSLVDFRFWRNTGVALYDMNKYVEDLVTKSGIKKYYLASPDKDLIVMNFSMKKPMSDVNFVTQAVETLKEITKDFEAKYNVKVYFTGGVMTTYESNQQAVKDFAITSVVSFIAIMVILIIGFGNILEIMIQLVGLVLAMGTSLGILSLCLGELNIVTTFVNALLLGIGVDYATYMVIRIQERFNLEGVSEESVVNAFIENFRPSFVSMVTTAIAFLTMLMSPSSAVKQMGISVSLGVAIYYFFFITLLPAVYCKILKRFKIRKRETYMKVVDIIRRSRVLMVSTIVLTIAFSVIGIYSLMNFSYTASSLISSNAESTIAQNMISEKFGSVGSSDIVIAEPTAEKLKETITKLREKGLIQSDFSILSLIQDPEKIAEDRSNIYVQVLELTHTPFLEILFKKYGLYESFISTVDVIKNISTTEDLFKLMEKDIPSLFYRDMNGNNLLLAYVTPTMNVWEGNNIKTFFESVKDYRVYGYTALFYKVIDELFHSTMWVFGLVLLVELIIIYIDFRNFRKSFYVISLTILNTVSAFGISYLVGIKSNFITFIILPMFLGMALDSLVEFTHSVEYGRESILKTEKAIIVCILTTVASFASLLIAKGQLLREFGFVASAGLMGSIFISLFWYLNTIDKGPMKRRGRGEITESDVKESDQNQDENQEED